MTEGCAHIPACHRRGTARCMRRRAFTKFSAREQIQSRTVAESNQTGETKPKPPGRAARCRPPCRPSRSARPSARAGQPRAAPPGPAGTRPAGRPGRGGRSPSPLCRKGPSGKAAASPQAPAAEAALPAPPGRRAPAELPPSGAGPGGAGKARRLRGPRAALRKWRRRPAGREKRGAPPRPARPFPPEAAPRLGRQPGGRPQVCAGSAGSGTGMGWGWRGDVRSEGLRRAPARAPPRSVLGAERAG